MLAIARRPRPVARLALLALLLVGLQASAATAEPTSLRWKWQPDREWKVNFEQRGSIATTVNRRTVRVGTEMDLAMTWRVDQVDQNGAARLIQTFDRIRFKLSTAKDGTVEWDSASEILPLGKAKELADQLKPLVGESVRLTVTPTGEIQKVEPLELDEPSDEQNPSRLKSLLSRDEMQQLLSQSFPEFPAEPVEPGGSWKQQRTADFGQQQIATTTTYSFEGLVSREDREVAHLKTSTDMMLKGGESTRDGPAIKSHSLSGDLYFDATAGEMVESQVTQKLVTELPFRDQVIVTEAENTYTVKYD